MTYRRSASAPNFCCYGLEVFRARSQHRRPTDVDELHLLPHGLLSVLPKGIEVHDDEIEQHNPVVSGRFQILRLASARQDATEDFRVERFHSAIHHLRELGQLFDGRNGNSQLFDEGGGSES